MTDGESQAATATSTPTRSTDTAMTNEPGAAENELAVGPSLHLMPEAVLGRIFQSMKAHTDASTLISLEMTCTSLNSALASDILWAQTLDNGRSDPEFLNEPEYEGLPTWRDYVLRRSALRKIRTQQRSTDNIVLGTLGGADGVRNLADALLRRMSPQVDEVIHKMYLRADTISYLAEVLDDYMVTKFIKAFTCTTFRSGPDDKDPVVRADDIAFLSKLDEIGTGPRTGPLPFMEQLVDIHFFDIAWARPGDDWSNILSSNDARLLIRRLAYRAGVCKMSACAFKLATTDFLNTMSFLLVDAFETSRGLAPTSIEDMMSMEDPRYITSDQVSFGAAKLKSGEITLEPDYYQKMCPPFHSNEDGKIVCVIIPRQIQDAASRCGLKRVYGHSCEGYHFFEPGAGQTQEEERDDAMSQYYVEDDDYESSDSSDSDESSGSYESSNSNDSNGDEESEDLSYESDGDEAPEDLSIEGSRLRRLFHCTRRFGRAFRLKTFTRKLRRTLSSQQHQQQHQ